MDPSQLTDDQLDQLAQQLAGRLPTGTHGDRVVLTRRQFAAASAGVLSTGALMALGVDEASAQAAGQQGTQSAPNDMFAWNLDVQNGATFNGTALSGVGAFDANSVSTEQRTINKVAGRGKSDSTQSISPATTTTVELDAVDVEDDSSVLDVDTTNDRIRVKKAGWISIQGSISYADPLPDGTTYFLDILINGTRVAQVQHSTGTATFASQGVSDVLDLSVDDDITLQVRQNSGSSVDLRGDERVSLAAVHEG